MTAFFHSSPVAVTAAALASAIGLLVATAMAQSDSESGEISEKLVLSEAAIKGLTESLAIANGETELFKRKYDDLNTRVEALGIAPVGKETETLRSRLLAAVRDMRLLQRENDVMREQAVRLTESVIEMLKISDGVDAKSRMKVEGELRSLAALTSASKKSENNSDLTTGVVVDYKPELALVVANLGSAQGVKTGMPFQVWRGDQQVASARVVDVRDSISGAIVQTPTSEPIHAGDVLRLDTIR